MARILVTGAAGFIGRALCCGLVERGHSVLGAVRGQADPIAGVELRPIGDIGPRTDWSRHFDGVEFMIHLANRAHRPMWAGTAADEAEAAAALARAAAAAGVRRLLHMSSARAMGDFTLPGTSFRAADPPQPRDAYGRGKLAIERALLAAARETGLDVVIMRPPLVYGPGVKGNFRALMRLVASGVPLPLAGIDNRRSLVFLDNLVDLASRACVHPGAVGRILLARDTTDLSTPELIRALAAGLGRPVRLFALSGAVLAAFRPFPGLAPIIARLTLSLQVDDSETRALLGWQPPISHQIGLAATARAFREPA